MNKEGVVKICDFGSAKVLSENGLNTPYIVPLIHLFIIVLDEKEHPVFKRNGIDLIMQQNINITEALCGFKKTVPTLDDRTLVIQTVSGKY